MIRALSTAALGMSAQQKMVDNIANNLANVNTTGFKKSRIAFQDLFYETLTASKMNGVANGTGGETPSLQIGHGVQTVGNQRNFMQGSVSETGNPLDVAINGDGFFQVERPDGTIAYTRDGNFSLDASGSIITNSGLRLADQIEVPPDAVGINISQNGEVKALMSGDGEPITLGQLELAKFANPAGLIAQGNNLYSQSESSGLPFFGTPGSEGFGSLQQGFLEQSNVEIVNEMVTLIEAQRAYETNSKMVQTVEEMMSMTNAIKR